MSTRVVCDCSSSGTILPSQKLFKSLEKRRSNKVTFNLHLPFKPSRNEVEKFVWEGFKKHYQAQIQHYLPNLISVSEKRKIAAVLGFRSARIQPLFVEQYLDKSIENKFSGELIERCEIGEIGNLYGINNLLTRQLLVITIMAMSNAGIKKLVFSATPQVKAMINRLSVKTTYIGNAAAEKIGSQIESWGDYYFTAPEVLAISTQSAIEIIEESSYLKKFTARYQSTIESLAENFVK